MTKRTQFACAFAAAAVVVFLWLASEVLQGRTLASDIAVREAVHGWTSAPLTVAMWSITILGAPLFLLGLGIILVWRMEASGRRRAALMLTLAGAGGEIIQLVLKTVYHRRRPEAFFGYPEPASYSFPSGHAALSCCFYGVLAAIISRRIPSPGGRAGLWAAAVVLIGLIGYSRIYLGVHYLSDVLGGYAAGLFWLAALWAIDGVRRKS